VTRQEKAGKTKQARIEKEFGIPFKKAAELRAVYYHQGYGAATAKLKPLVAALRKEVEELREQVQGKQS
jgi:uncharacterized protein (DUF2164 family)